MRGLISSFIFTIFVFSQVRPDVVYPGPVKTTGTKLLVGGGGGSKAVIGGGLGVSLGKGGGKKLGGGVVVKSGGGNTITHVGGHGYFPSKNEVTYGGGGYGPSKLIYRKVANVGPLRQFCPFGWDHYAGSCYYFSRNKLSWFDAAMKCAYMGGYLAIANEAHENSYLKLMCHKNKMTFGVWFGLNNVLFPKSHSWLWGYGKKACTWFDWFGKGPKFKGPHHKCVAFTEGYHYQWAVENCRRKMYYICELNPKKPCVCKY